MLYFPETCIFVSTRNVGLDYFYTMFMNLMSLEAIERKRKRRKDNLLNDFVHICCELKTNFRVRQGNHVPCGDTG